MLLVADELRCCLRSLLFSASELFWIIQTPEKRNYDCSIALIYLLWSFLYQLSVKFVFFDACIIPK